MSKTRTLTPICLVEDSPQGDHLMRLEEKGKSFITVNHLLIMEIEALISISAGVNSQKNVILTSLLSLCRKSEMNVL